MGAAIATHSAETGAVIRAVAWDIDGTLIDSEPLHHAALVAVSARHGATISAHDPRLLGLPMDLVWRNLRHLYPAGLTQAAWTQAILETYMAGAAGLFAFPDVVDTMRRLHENGIVQCCVSNSGRRVVDANLAAIGVSHLVSFAISRDDVAVGKPDPAPYREACRRLGFKSAEVLAVEDSPPGVASARAAGCPVMQYGVDFARHAAIADRVLASPAA